ncbi:unnamed protein product [Darwinula stevensoni]|uniref:Profilin n=1 Tax=Darwinula stevensoni TaxID=69355 RepID=A0A7R8ZYM6_9CRUS|nr:unnamed protein product [Darwinula stevensoni]CAG0881808.1 unnamed protein product [Darwinula stevensoni]
MSWQDYIDKQLIGSKNISQAAIAGHDGNVWAKSDGFNVSKEEIVRLMAGLGDPTQFHMNGVHVNGTRFVYLSGNDQVVRAKKDKMGLHCVKTNQAVIVATYNDPIQPQQAASTAEGLGDYLIQCGY